MKIKTPKNINYCAIVIEITKLIHLENCTNVQGAIIMGNQVVISKDIKVGDIGLYFPLECQLSKEYLSNNNLYNKPELNVDNTKKGYFDENGRIRCQRFRGHKSEGLFMPINSIEFTFNSNPSPMPIINDCFDELNGIPICKKYYVSKPTSSKDGFKQKGKDKKLRQSKLVENQFRFHQDTSMLYRNLHRIHSDSLISCTYKLHGCVSEDTIINTDQGDFTIKFIVDNKLNVNIKAFDTETNQVVYVPIDAYYLLKNDGEWYEIELENGTILKITGNNPVWLPELNCYRKAELLNVSDVLLVSE